MLEDAGFEVSVTKTDLGSKESILALVEYATGKGGTLSVYGDTAEYDCPPVCLCLLSVDIELLLSAKLQNDTFSLSATPINRRCGFLFRKVSPPFDNHSSAVRKNERMGDTRCGQMCTLSL